MPQVSLPISHEGSGLQSHLPPLSPGTTLSVASFFLTSLIHSLMFPRRHVFFFSVLPRGSSRSSFTGFKRALARGGSEQPELNTKDVRVKVLSKVGRET